MPTREERMAVERTPPPDWVIKACGAKSIRPKPVVDVFEEDTRSMHKMFESIKYAVNRHGSVSIEHEPKHGYMRLHIR